MSSFLNERQYLLPLDEKSLQEISTDAGPLHGSFLEISLFLLYLNVLLDDDICNIAIC